MDDFFKNQLLLLKQDEGINEKRCDLRMDILLKQDEGINEKRCDLRMEFHDY